MARDHEVDRRRFLATAGEGAADRMVCPVSAQDTLTIRRQDEIPHRPDVLVVGEGAHGWTCRCNVGKETMPASRVENQPNAGGAAGRWCRP